jgi:DNA polymerase delta subunit 1
VLLLACCCCSDETSLHLLSQGADAPAVRNVMTLNTCASIVGAEVMSFEKEADMLLRWRDLMLEADADVIIGYNITNFDLPYLYE